MGNDIDKILIPSRKGGGKAPSLLTGFILAAGLGERLRPITNHNPKPLMPILGKPVLELILEKVLPFANTIGINLHHKKELIAEYINNSPFKEKVNIFYEEPILGTGGALKNAEALLSKGTFLVHNGDILSDIDLGKLIEFHCSSKNIATLAVHACPQFNNLEIDGNGLLKGIRKPPPLNPLPSPRLAGSREGKQMVPSPFAGDTTSLIPSTLVGEGQGEGGNKLKAFTGIAVYEPEFLKFLPPGKSSIIDAWLKAVDAGHKIGTMDVSGCYWTDIGTPAAYAAAVVNALRASGETIYIRSGAGCRDIELDGYVVIEKDVTPTCIKSLRNCIILPLIPPHQAPTPALPHEGGWCVREGERELKEISPPLMGGDKGEGEEFSYENCIICQDIKIDLNESEMLGFKKDEDILIGVGGSDRRYYRRRKNKQTEVFVRYAQNDADFQRNIEFTKFFRKYNIPVPELIDVDYENRAAVFEDLGDLSLYSWLKCKHVPECLNQGREKKQIEEMYKKVLSILIEIHTTTTSHAVECQSLQERVFDYEHAKWETDYFMKEFVEGIKGIDIDAPSLKKEFHKLALMADSFPKTIIHRDFQSQNIMVKKGAPRLIDYQGARMGPPAYDVASILYDPYFRLEEISRKPLLDYYIQRMKKKSGDKFKEADFIESLKVCRLQRHMQALGAYGFLSTKKGKRYFLKHIPEGLRLLKEDMILAKSEYPAMYELISRL